MSSFLSRLSSAGNTMEALDKQRMADTKSRLENEAMGQALGKQAQDQQQAQMQRAAQAKLIMGMYPGQQGIPQSNQGQDMDALLANVGSPANEIANAPRVPTQQGLPGSQPIGARQIGQGMPIPQVQDSMMRPGGMAPMGGQQTPPMPNQMQPPGGQPLIQQMPQPQRVPQIPMQNQGQQQPQQMNQFERIVSAIRAMPPDQQEAAVASLPPQVQAAMMLGQLPRAYGGGGSAGGMDHRASAAARIYQKYIGAGMDPGEAMQQTQEDVAQLYGEQQPGMALQGNTQPSPRGMDGAAKRDVRPPTKTEVSTGKEQAKSRILWDGQKSSYTDLHSQLGQLRQLLGEKDSAGKYVTMTGTGGGIKRQLRGAQAAIGGALGVDIGGGKEATALNTVNKITATVVNLQMALNSMPGNRFTDFARRLLVDSKPDLNYDNDTNLGIVDKLEAISSMTETYRDYLSAAADASPRKIWTSADIATFDSFVKKFPAFDEDGKVQPDNIRRIKALAEAEYGASGAEPISEGSSPAGITGIPKEDGPADYSHLWGGQ